MRKLFRNQQLILFLIQGSFFGNGLCVSQDQKSTYYHTGDRIGYCGKCTLCKHLLDGLGVDGNIQHGGHQDPGQQMSHDIGQRKESHLLLAELAFLQVQLLGEQAHHNTHKGGGDDPAPPGAAAPGQVDEGVADEADQAADHGAVHGSQQGQRRTAD